MQCTSSHFSVPKHRRNWRSHTTWAMCYAAAVVLNTPGALAFTYDSQPKPELYEKGITQPPCDFIIDNTKKWADINSTGYRVFCVAPGDYTMAGAIEIRASGTETQKRWIRYHNPSLPETAHPYHMSAANKAVVRGFFFNGASHWVLDRITIDAGKAGALAKVVNSNRNIFNRIDGLNFSQGFDFTKGSSHNTLQRSTIRDINPKSDGTAIQVNGMSSSTTGSIAQPQFNVIVNNEIWNVNDGFQAVGAKGDGGEDYRGTVVYYNDIYLTSSRYTDCNGRYTTSGNCAPDENAIDIKSGSGSAQDPVIIAHNRFWGFRETDSVASPQSDSPGAAITQHNGGDNIKIQGNIIWDAPLAHTMGDRIGNIEISGNLFHSTNRRTDGKATTVLNYLPNGTKNLLVKKNVITQQNPAPRWTAKFGNDVTSSATFTFTDNVLIDSKGFSGAASTSGVVARNRYYNSDRPTWDKTPAVYAPSADEAGYGAFCFLVQRITAPKRVCLERSLPSVGGAIPAPSELKAF